MRTLLISAFIFLAAGLNAQQDYFYAEDLFYQEKYTEAIKVLDHLTAAGAYADRPRFAMMTLNLSGTAKLYTKDTVGAKQAFISVMACYDSLTPPRKADDWNKREYYIGGEKLAWLCYRQHDYVKAGDLLKRIGYPGHYYSATGSDVLAAQDDYCRFRSFVFQKLDQPDSAFTWILKIRDNENPIVHPLDSIFNSKTNHIGHVKFVFYTQKCADPNIHSPGYLYFVPWNDEQNTQHSIWMVNPESGNMSILGMSTYNLDDPKNFPANCYDMSLSPDEKYLAVTCYTEGSNHIDIFSFPEILAEKRCMLLQNILAYPSSVEIKGWDKSDLIVESDADLTRYNKKGKLNFDVMPDPDVRALYLYDITTGKFSKK